MKIVCISDIHGHLPEKMPEGDVLIISGDICPATNHSVGYQAEWLEKRFNLWLDYLSYKDILCIAGNHDFVFEKAPELVPDLNCHYLQESSVDIDGLKFYGYPHTPFFYDWAFNRYRYDMKMVVDKIPDDTNVLITHGPPYGILDTVEGVLNIDGSKENLGCKDLRNRLDNLPELMLNVFGHIHSSHGIKEIGKTKFVNASHLNESYDPDYGIITVEI